MWKDVIVLLFLSFESTLNKYAIKQKKTYNLIIESFLSTITSDDLKFMFMMASNLGKN